MFISHYDIFVYDEYNIEFSYNLIILKL